MNKINMLLASCAMMAPALFAVETPKVCPAGSACFQVKNECAKPIYFSAMKTLGTIGRIGIVNDVEVGKGEYSQLVAVPAGSDLAMVYLGYKPGHFNLNYGINFANTPATQPKVAKKNFLYVTCGNNGQFMYKHNFNGVSFTPVKDAILRDSNGEFIEK